jgi:hypothetical protein
MPKAGPDCILCGRPSTITGVFIPGETDRRFGFRKPETRRHFIYPLCDRCFRQTDVAEAVEIQIEKELNAQGVVVSNVLQPDESKRLRIAPLAVGMN